MNKGEMNIKLDQAEFIAMGPVSRDFISKVTTPGVRKISNSLFDLLTETWTKRLPTVNEFKILDIP